MPFRRGGAGKKRDANEKDIVAALRAIGADVTQVSGVGAPDLLIRFRGQLWGFEVKGGKGVLTKAQQETRWPVVRSVSEAFAVIGIA
jgi:hypothetical protein